MCGERTRSHENLSFFYSPNKILNGALMCMLCMQKVTFYFRHNSLKMSHSKCVVLN